MLTTDGSCESFSSVLYAGRVLDLGEGAGEVRDADANDRDIVSSENGIGQSGSSHLPLTMTSILMDLPAVVLGLRMCLRPVPVTCHEVRCFPKPP